jgi:hypothetical protein
MAEVLTSDYLGEHGIGAVVVTGTARTAEAAQAAASAPKLERVRTGVYDVYLVREPTSIVTFAGVQAESMTVADQSVEAVGMSSGGTAVVRRNWFPRWRATVNGEAVPITETADGYMSIPIPSGRAEIELRYIVDRWDWLGRAMCGAGLVLVIALAVSSLAPRMRLRKESATPRARSARR